jgi:hypothetical protein
VDCPLPIELVEDQPHDARDLFVRIEGHLTRRVLEVADRDGHDQLAATRLVELALIHAPLEDVKLRLVPPAVQAQDQAVRMLRRVVHAVGVGQQHAEAGAPLPEGVPVLARASAATPLRAEDQPDAVPGDFRE